MVLRLSSKDTKALKMCFSYKELRKIKNSEWLIFIFSSYI